MSPLSRRTVAHARQSQARPDTHPMWCEVTRCLSPYADPVGGHRSSPRTLDVPPLGKVVLTLAQRAGGPVFLDITMTVAVPTRDESRQALFARRLLERLGSAIADAAGLTKPAPQKPQRTPIGQGGHR